MIHHASWMSASVRLVQRHPQRAGKTRPQLVARIIAWHGPGYPSAHPGYFLAEKATKK
jgi:hypothetical protein